MKKNISVPLDVPASFKSLYTHNYNLATHESDKLMLFAGDQKIEHLNKDFYGEGISQDDADPVHLFNIASKAKIGVFAAQLGLIAQYGSDFPDIPYLVKLNSKTNLVKKDLQDPRSPLLYPVSSVVEFKKNSGLNILGVGFTIYLGSEFEGEMIQDAVRIVYTAHLHGLLTVLWIYPRGKSVEDEKNPHLIAGAAGVAACLGSDFVKVNPPKQEGTNSAELLKEAVTAAGKTKVVCAGGSSTDVEKFLSGLHDQIHIGGASGNATGRNIHQKPLDEAIRFCNAIFAITVENKSVADSLKIYQSK
ncbi:MAG: aldolase [bacterium]|nr:aldolase [bacterium]